MPTYEYKCTKCSYIFEEFQRMTDEPLKNCPKCGGTLKRIIGPGAGPIFKGSGFYQTDYKKSKTTAPGESKSGDSSTGTLQENKSSEVKKLSPKKEDQ